MTPPRPPRVRPKVFFAARIPPELAAEIRATAALLGVPIGQVVADAWASYRRAVLVAAERETADCARRMADLGTPMPPAEMTAVVARWEAADDLRRRLAR